MQYLLFSETNELLVLWRGQAEMLRVEWGTENATLRKASACQRGYDYKPCTKSFILFQKVYKGRIYNFINIIIIIMLQKLTMFYVTWELDHQILDENTFKSPFYNPILILRQFADC